MAPINKNMERYCPVCWREVFPNAHARIESHVDKHFETCPAGGQILFDLTINGKPRRKRAVP